MTYYLDLMALIWFLACWVGYTWYSRNRANSRSCLSNTLDLYREDWMRVMLKRENRISDASVVGNLERNGAFFASSCLLILAGIITALGYTSEAMEVFATVPFSVVPTREVWELRLVVLLVVFVYAFFKFTWSMRMYNFVAVMIGSAPLPDNSKTSPAAREAFARSAGNISNLVGDESNLGLGSFYYALAVEAWFIHPLAVIAVAAVLVFFWSGREFRCGALYALRAVKVVEGARPARHVDEAKAEKRSSGRS